MYPSHCKCVVLHFRGRDSMRGMRMDLANAFCMATATNLRRLGLPQCCLCRVGRSIMHFWQWYRFKMRSGAAICDIAVCCRDSNVACIQNVLPGDCWKLCSEFRFGGVWQCVHFAAGWDVAESSLCSQESVDRGCSEYTYIVECSWGVAQSPLRL